MLTSLSSKTRDLRQTFGQAGVEPWVITALHKLALPLQFVTVLFAAAALFKASLLEAFYVPSTSMAPTLQVNDFILVPKFSYGLRIPFFSRPLASWAEPQRGDVVVFRRIDDPRTGVNEGARPMVKRVVAVGGDLVEVRGKQVFVNGVPQNEPYARWEISGAHKDFAARRVPRGSLFVLGDNRDESQDSRFWSIPFVRTDQVLGKAVCVYWSKADTNRVGVAL